MFGKERPLWTCIAGLFGIWFSSTAIGQNVGDRVLLIERDIGIPGHAAIGESRVSIRFPGETTAEVIEANSEGTWFHIIDEGGAAAWIIKKYVARVVADNTPPPAAGAECYRVGTWNLEHFKFGKKRGFPEDGDGGPSYDERTDEEFGALARAIRDYAQFRVLVLNEINGRTDAEGEETVQKSDELDKLLTYLGPEFTYLIGSSGGEGGQRVAILYDKRFAELAAATEILVPRIDVQGKDIFDRDPLLGAFVALENGARLTDFVVVALHLASGQDNAKNHDAAMDRLVRELEDLRADGSVLGHDEADILLMGDLNANKYRNPEEAFFETLNTGNWALLAPEVDYPATRLSGVPLQPRTSQIDYILSTRKTASFSGLLGEELTEDVATVHQDLADGDWEGFRRAYSDHFPVSTCLRLAEDAD